MKQLITLIGIAIFSSCNTQTSNQPLLEAEDMPVGAIQEPFEDNPNMVKVTTTAADGNVLAYGIYVDGVREGSWTDYHPNGYIKTITGYVAGVKEGQAIELDNRGQLLQRFTYHQGQLHGPYTKFNRSRIKEQKNYTNGNLEGKSEIFYDNGKVMEEGYYKNGKRDGIAKWFDQEGNVTIEYVYKDGEWIKDEE